MRINSVAGAFLAVLTLAVPAAPVEPVAPVPAAHEELARALDELAGQLHGLGSRWRDHFAHRGAHAERPLITLMLRHRDELGLSADQIQSLEQLRADFQREAIRREADLRVAEMELATLLEAEAPDLGQVEAKLREIERLRADLRLARIRVIEQGKARLTPEQRAKLRTLLAEPRHPRLRTNAPHPAGREQL